ncbi:TCO89 [Candida margitis]|uniref:TCO89 n=1 Tax=Candida margitis TaxID=1775924 RepID=UPI002226A4DC|nr:TCO89 [Candida margitis]KAI5953102.1 TCO89 [Candida margitis]
MTTESEGIDRNEGSDHSGTPSVDSDNSNSSRGNNKSSQTTTHLRPSLQGVGRSSSSSNVSVNTSNLISHRKPHPSRLKTHNRSLSHNKLLNKLSTSTTPATVRPNLNRSKSTDGLTKGGRHATALKRNNRSFTKITGLQPLTKTVSNQSVKSNKSSSSLKGLGVVSSTATGGIKPSARRGKATINLEDDDKEYEDVDEPPDEKDVAAPQPERFDSQETVSTTHSTSDQNIPSLYEQINRILPDPTPQDSADYDNRPKLDVVEEGKPVNDKTTNKGEPRRPDLVSSVQSSAEDVTQNNNLYGSSLLLSQSTGVVRKIDPINAKVTEIYPNRQGQNDTQQPESVSGISFKANPMEAVNNNNNIAKPVTTNQNVSQKNSYQPDQTIFTNLQRTNNQYMQGKQTSERLPNTRPIQTSKNTNPLNNGANNYGEFLRSTSSSSDSQHGPSKNIETRTQQKLWLQRESSLLDVTNMDPARRSNFSNLSLNNLMFSHNYNQSHSSGQWPSNPNSYQSQHGVSSTIGPLTPVTPGTVQGVPGFSNGTITPDRGMSNVNVNGLLHVVQNAHQNSIQSRTEFERLNREYLNVRRHLNPVGEGLNRLKSVTEGHNEIKVAKSKKRPESSNANANTFEEFAPSFHARQAETMGTVNKIWQDAILWTLSSSRVGPYSQENATNPQHPPNNRVSSFVQNSPYAKHGQHQSARAVKLAQNQSHVD